MAVALFIFLMSVHGLATAIAVLKIGRHILGEGYCTKEGCSSPGHPHELRKFIGRIPRIGDLFYCTPCLSFWIGMGFSWKVLSPARAVCPVWWQAMVLDGLMACAVSWLLFLVAKKTEQGLDL
jgi:hypothetical protein